MIEVNPRVKDALRSGAYRKNYRINVLNDDGTTDFTLNNTELVSESVKIDERMCSGDTLKFGLCEGSSIEFQYFNHDNINHPNIRGRRIQVFVDVQYKDADGELDWESIPLGFFDVQECSTQFSTGIMKVVGYNKLKSAYLDNKANDQIVEIVQTGVTGSSGNMEIGLILTGLLDGYTIYDDYTKKNITRITLENDMQEDIQLLEVVDPNQQILSYLGYLDDFWFRFDPSPSKMYRMWLNPKKIYEKIMSYVPQECLYKEYVYHQPVGERISLKDRLEDWMNAPIIVIAITSSHDSAQLLVDLKECRDVDGMYTGWITNTMDVSGANFPIFWKSVPYTGQQRDPKLGEVFTAEDKDEALRRATEILMDDECFRIEETTEEGMAAFSLSVAQAEALPDVTLRELQSAVFETAAEFGQLSRTTDLFDGVTLSRERLFPADDLYPANDLYPQGTSESTFKSMYEKLWTDSVGEQTFRKLYITYKGLDEQQREKEFVLERTVNADGTTDYYCDDNWLFKNLIWTEQQVGDYADAMVLKMRGIKWFPFEMWCAGLPYIEVGDELEIISKDGTYTSYVLQRSLNGIQNLKDTYINGSLDIF